MGFPSAWSLLRRYFQLYWLKPFDAVNDAANAWALSQFEWVEPILEVGGGDGVFSFILHGGEFFLSEDRYRHGDLRLNDIYDVYRSDRPLRIKHRIGRRYEVGADLKLSHLQKSEETGLYQRLLSIKPEALPLGPGSFKTVFLYTFHGLTDYRRCLKEIRRVIRPDGTLLMIAFNQVVSRQFICYPLHKWFERLGWKGLSAYFLKLDNGRYEELTGFSRSFSEWKRLLEEADFQLTKAYNQVSPLAWRVYDLQTRPLLRPLIRFSEFLERLHLKTPVKALWVYLFLPLLVVFYETAARPRRIPLDDPKASGIFFAFHAVPSQNRSPAY